jgi:hypothetical protein
MEVVMKALLTKFSLVAIAASSTAGAAPAVGRPSNAHATKYCLQYEQEIGTHVRRSECRTKEDWKQQGIDVDAELAKANHGAPTP